MRRIAKQADSWEMQDITTNILDKIPDRTGIKQQGSSKLKKLTTPLRPLASSHTAIWSAAAIDSSTHGPNANCKAVNSL